MVQNTARVRQQRVDEIAKLSAELEKYARRMSRLASFDEWTDIQERTFYETEREYEKTMRQINAKTNI